MMIRMSPQSETSWGLTTSDRLKQTCTNKLFLIDVWWSPIIATSDGFANWDNCTHHQDLWTSQQMINFSFRDDRKSFNHMTTCDYNHFLMSFAPIWPLHTFSIPFQFHFFGDDKTYWSWQIRALSARCWLPMLYPLSVWSQQLNV